MKTLQLKQLLGVIDQAGGIEKFLNKNVLRFQMGQMTPSQWSSTIGTHQFIGPLQRTGGHRPQRVTIDRYDRQEDHMGVTNGGSIYVAKPDGTGGGTAHFLPWNEDAGYSITLGADAQIFFNAEMSGCAFGCNAGPNGVVRVSHHNIQAPDGRTDRAAMSSALGSAGYQKPSFRALFSTPVSNTWEPSDYRNEEDFSSVIGLREGKKWQVYAQNYAGGCSEYTVTRVQRLM